MNEREAVRKSYFFISALTVALLFGCSSTPQMDASASRQVLASTPKDQGEVIFFTIGQWMPNTKEFRFSADAQTPKIPGVVVVTNKNILFEQWGGSTGLSIVKKIAIADILDASFITFGASGRMIIQSQENQYDSFAASETTGVISIRKGTEEMHQAVSSLLRSRKRELN